MNFCLKYLIFLVLTPPCNEAKYRTPSTFIPVTPAGEMEATREYFISANYFLQQMGAVSECYLVLT